MHGFQSAATRKAPLLPPMDHQHKANGGPVRGPGTGTSDSIEKTVPEGTYIMPADTTAKVGEGQVAGLGAPVPCV